MVLLKGTKDGLLITIGNGEWQEVLSELATQLDRPRAAQFFRGARARLAPGERALSDLELLELNNLLEQHAMQLDLQPPLPPRPRPRIQEEPHELETPADNGDQQLWMDAALVRRTVRSGQVIRYPGHIVVYGDVNPGSEIVAGGDVIIWGKLRGVVHAGASGDDKAIVGALLLAPMQLRIGSYIARAPDDRGKKERGAEIARIRDGRIVIESWKAGKE